MDRQQSITLSDDVHTWFKDAFHSGRQGMTQVVDDFHATMKDNPVVGMFSDPITAHNFMLGTWAQMWRHFLVNTKGVFSEGELSLLIDIYNGTMLSPWHYGSNSLAACISDSIALDGVGEKWEVDAGTILGKVKALTPVQALCLELWANGFWYSAIPKNGRDFAEYIKQLS